MGTGEQAHLGRPGRPARPQGIPAAPHPQPQRVPGTPRPQRIRAPRPSVPVAPPPDPSTSGRPDPSVQATSLQQSRAPPDPSASRAPRPDPSNVPGAPTLAQRVPGAPTPARPGHPRPQRVRAPPLPDPKGVPGNPRLARPGRRHGPKRVPGAPPRPQARPRPWPCAHPLQHTCHLPLLLCELRQHGLQQENPVCGSRAIRSRRAPCLALGSTARSRALYRASPDVPGLVPRPLSPCTCPLPRVKATAPPRGPNAWGPRTFCPGTPAPVLAHDLHPRVWPHTRGDPHASRKPRLCAWGPPTMTCGNREAGTSWLGHITCMLGTTGLPGELGPAVDEATSPAGQRAGEAPAAGGSPGPLPVPCSRPLPPSLLQECPQGQAPRGLPWPGHEHSASSHRLPRDRSETRRPFGGPQLPSSSARCRAGPGQVGCSTPTQEPKQFPGKLWGWGVPQP